MSGRLAFILSFLLGAGSAFAFQPVAWWWLMPLAFAALCELIDRQPSLKRALLIGWLFGLGQFVVGLNWIATAFTFQAKMPPALGWVAVVLLSLYLAVYPMLATGLAWRFGKDKPLPLVLALAGGWAITEWLRATMFTGFAWNPVGVVGVDRLADLAPFVGTYGLSAIVVLVGGGLWQLSKWEGRLISAVVIFVVFATLAGDALKPPLDRSGPLRPVRVVQPNIGQQDKWRPGFEAVAARKLDLLTIKGPPVARLVLWPEAAVTNPLQDGRRFTGQVTETERLRATRSLGPGDVLITGGLGITSRDGLTVDGATNSVYVMQPLGKIVGRYDKAHLVPYGEYLPMRPLLSRIGLSRLAPGDLDFAAGPGPRTIQLPGHWGKVGFQLCYEIIFSGEVVDRRNRPDFIFNPSNDAWFGRWGPPQHLAQARLRAAEEGLPVIRATPTGISALIDANGRLLQSQPWQTVGVIDATLPPARAPTPFARLGNIIPLTLGFLALIAAIAVGRSRRYSANT